MDFKKRVEENLNIAKAAAHDSLVKEIDQFVIDLQTELAKNKKYIKINPLDRRKDYELKRRDEVLQREIKEIRDHEDLYKEALKNNDKTKMKMLRDMIEGMITRFKNEKTMKDSMIPKKR